MKANNPVFLSLSLITAAIGYLWLVEIQYIGFYYADSSNIAAQRLNIADKSPTFPDKQPPSSPPFIYTQQPIKPIQTHRPPNDNITHIEQLNTQHQLTQRRQLIKNYLSRAKQKQQKLEQLIAQGRKTGIEKQRLIEGLNKLAALKEGIKMAQRDLNIN